MMMTEKKSWMDGLEKKGLYYDGTVSDLDNLLEKYRRDTVTTWGTRRSSANTGSVNAVS